MGVELWELGVRLDSVEDFANFGGFPDDSFTFDNGRDLLNAQGVAFNGKAAVNGADLIGFA